MKNEIEKRNVIVGIAAILATVPATLATAQDLDLSDITLPPGFAIDVYAADVPNARSLALGDDGVVYVSTRRDGRIFALLPQDDGSQAILTIDEDLKVPNGIAYRDGDLYVAETTRVLRYPGVRARLLDPPAPEVIGEPLPGESHHGWRYIAFGPDGKLYITIGAPCNVCDREGFGLIVRQNADGSGREVFAEGVRNSVGLAWHPRTRDLWFTDNGRDMLGDDLPPGELNRAPAAGLHFGFPYCHAGEIPDPEFGQHRNCSEFAAPAQKLGPHVAPLGLRFYTGSMFPAEYQGQIFIAEHGSWNRSKKIGYRLSLVRLHNGRPASYETFAEGWLQNEQASGRPVDVLVLDDGSMLVSDDKAGRIYRISYSTLRTEGLL